MAFVRKPTEIVDYLLARTEGLERGDIDARLKALRAADLWPAARRVGARDAGEATPQDCANLLMALVGSEHAVHSATAVERLSSGRLESVMVYRKGMEEPEELAKPPAIAEGRTFGGLLATVIRDGRTSLGEVELFSLDDWPIPQLTVLTAPSRRIGGYSLTYRLKGGSFLRRGKPSIKTQRTVYRDLIRVFRDFVAPNGAGGPR